MLEISLVDKKKWIFIYKTILLQLVSIYEPSNITGQYI